jgi:neutral ceramidase
VKRAGNPSSPPPRAVQLAGVFAVSLSISCTLVVPGYRVKLPTPTAKFLAGAEKVDITPPPCYPTGGHGPAGAVAKAYWNRLYARVFYFDDGRGNHVVLASADLFALPAGLHAAVARRVSREGLSIAPQEIVLAATHTHHGPGNYTSEKVYNQHGSTYPGFDRRLFDFLVERIATAIKLAAGKARPANLVFKSGRADQLDGKTVPPFVRNRIPETVMLKPDRDRIMEALNPSISRDCTAMRLCWDRDGKPIPASAAARECERESGWDIDGCPRLRMADQALNVLEVRSGGTVVAALVFFAVHPTALLMNAPINSSDLAGVAMSRLETALSTDGTPAVVGFFNGAQGDITARRLRRDVKDVIRLGRRLADSVLEVMRRGFPTSEPEPAIATARTRVRSEEEDCTLPDGHDARLATKPILGAAALGGAEDDRTVLFDLGFREGMREQPKKGQGPKLAALDSPLIRELRLTALFAPPGNFPKRMDVTTVHVGNLVFVAVPVEMTTAMGYRIRQSLGMDPKRSAFIGLANGYSSYVTTPDEYLMQEYVGASTMWGPDEGPSIGCAIRRVVNGGNTVERKIGAKIFRTGPPPRDPFGPDFCGDARQRPDEELGNVLLEATGRPARDLPWFSWKEVRTRSSWSNKTRPTDFSSIASRTVSVFVKDETGWRRLEDDRGTGFITGLLHASRAGAQTWSALWLSPILDESLDRKKQYHFRVDWAQTGAAPPSEPEFPVCSEPFVPSDLAASGLTKVAVAGECPSGQMTTAR